MTRVASQGYLRWDLHRGLDHVADFTCRSVSFDSQMTALLRRSEIAHFSVLASEPAPAGILTGLSVPAPPPLLELSIHGDLYYTALRASLRGLLRP